LRNHISGDRKRKKHADSTTEEQQKGHFYPAVPLTRVRASNLMRKFLPPKHASQSRPARAI
jgi:hypothetical protein